MTPPKRWTPGDPLTADRLNEGISEAVRPRRDISLGNGSSMVNETLGNQSATGRFQQIKLVVAVENFVVSETPTDISGFSDDVPSGLVKEVRLNRRSGTHVKDEGQKAFRVYDVTAGLTGMFCQIGSDSLSISCSDSFSNSDSSSESAPFSSGSKNACDVFYVCFNQDSKRWEVFSVVSVSDRVVVLDDDLPAASHSLKCAKRRYATVCEWDPMLSEYVETRSQIEVWNHSENSSHPRNTFGYARWIDTHWHFFGDCAPMETR